jgi:FlaA1/EpsC-like NDP-sugar epimerase
MKLQQIKIIRYLGHVAIDILLIGSLLALIYWDSHLKLEISQTEMKVLLVFFGAIIASKIITLTIFKVYAIITVYFSIIDAIKVGTLSIVTTIIAYLFALFIPQIREFATIQIVLLLLGEAFLLISTRFIKRTITLIYVAQEKSSECKRTLIIGAGSGGKMVVDEIRNNPALNNKIIHIVDDDRKKIGAHFLGYRIIGPIKDISKLIQKHEIGEVIIAIAKIPKSRLMEIIRLMEHDIVKIKRLPLMSEIGDDAKRQVVDVDINELLGRKVVILENEKIKSILTGKKILVTGAGGSIGSELCRQIFLYRPKQLIMFDIYENGVYEVQQELIDQIRRYEIVDVEIIVLIGSTYNEKRVEQIFSLYQPEIVFHAAAYKHVPLMQNNPQEAIRTNIIGTYNIANMAKKYKAERLILISTDKAVRPTNIMGATKAYAELMIKYFSSNSENTIFSAVRFGNVLQSSGSVIPLFQRQISDGGPVTVTDEHITRYFMTISEAVSLILQTTIYAKGGEIFVLDMGEPVKIIDLAEKMIRQAGYVPYEEINIEIIGLRPGEKLYEELLINPETQRKTDNKKIYIETNIADSFSLTEYEKIVNNLDEKSLEIISQIEQLIKTSTRNGNK